MDRERKQLLLSIMAEEFTAIDLNLYLDTHPDDRKALADFYDTVERVERLKSQYERKYGPLTSFGETPSEQTWKWIEEPWPWEINFA